MDKLKIGVIGTGHMGRNHVRNLAEDWRFDMVGIYDVDHKNAEKVANQYEIQAFDTPEELFERIDAVVIAVPSSLHKEVGLMAVQHHVHALIEKPLATNSRDAREIEEAFSAKGLKLAVGHIERFNPVIQELEKLLNKEQVVCLEAYRYSPFSGSGRIADTSVVEDLMIHDVDYVCHLMEPYRVTKVYGTGECVRSECIDFASCTLNFNTNAHAVIHASRVSQDKERILRIHTRNSCICADLLGKTLSIVKNTDLIFERGGVYGNSYRQNGLVERIFVPIQEPLKEELVSFYHSVVDHMPVAVDGKTGIRAIEICEEVVRQTMKR